MTAENEKQVAFCPSCFADEESGSWNHFVVPVVMHCLNCGAGGAVMLPKWAVNEIRRNAAWVGARYYPDDDTKDELRALRKAIGTWPGRTATLVVEEGMPDRWRLRQECLGRRRGMWIETSVGALPGDTTEAVITRTADLLPWVGG